MITDQTREVFLIKFVLKLKSDRKNGAYPVQIKTTVQLEEQEIEQNFTVYVQINDEKSGGNHTDNHTDNHADNHANNHAGTDAICCEWHFRGDRQ